MIHATAIGNLGQDPEMRYLPNGDAVANISIATRTHKKDSDGKYITQWLRVALWGKQAKLAAEHLNTGARVAVMGSIELEKWMSKDKQRESGLRMNAVAIEFLNTKKPDGDDAEPEGGESPW